MSPALHRTIFRRLLPLYISSILQGFVLWYAIEKLFMTGIGFTPATIGLMAAAYSGMTLLIETPAGILADRWSRKGILMLAGLALAVSSLVCGLSHSVPVFIIGAGCWGIFMGLYTGAPDSIVYDTLSEEINSSHSYERYYGFVQLFHGAALICGSLLGGLIGATFGLRATFFLTIPISLLSLVVLIFLKEPQLHKVGTPDPLLTHAKSTLKALAHKDSQIGILIILILGGAIAQSLMEFDQLWLIAIHAPIIFYGTAGSLVLGAFALSGPLATRLKLNNQLFVVFTTTILLLSGIALTISHSVWTLALAQSLIVIILLSVGIIYLRRFHDRLPSKIRASSSSIVSSLSTICFIVISLLFGYITETANVFHSAWLILIPLILISAFLLKTAREDPRLLTAPSPHDHIPNQKPHQNN